MDNKEYFLFYKSWLDIIAKSIPDKDRQNRMLRAILEYGINSEKSYPEEKMFLEQVFAQIDYSKGKHEKAVESGRKGGQNGKGKTRNAGNKNASKTKANNSKTIANSNSNTNSNNNTNSNTITTHPSDITSSNVISSDVIKGRIFTYTQEELDELGDEYE